MRSPRIKRLLARAAVLWTDGRSPSGLPLPPRLLRAASGQFHSNDGFVGSAVTDAQRLLEHAQVGSEPRILDIGCGAGRLAIGLAEICDDAEYTGLDVMPAPIRWCTRHITPARPSFSFELLDIANDRYNPGGRRITPDFSLPVQGPFDAVYAYSVFSHMRSDEVTAYLVEIARLLAPSGRALVTAFVEEHVPDESINPDDYGPMAWRGPLHAVRFSLEHMTRMIDGAGLRLEVLSHGTETDGQSLLTLVPARRRS